MWLTKKAKEVLKKPSKPAPSLTTTTSAVVAPPLPPYQEFRSSQHQPASSYSSSAPGIPPSQADGYQQQQQHLQDDGYEDEEQEGYDDGYDDTSDQYHHDFGHDESDNYDQHHGMYMCQQPSPPTPLDFSPPPIYTEKVVPKLRQKLQQEPWLAPSHSPLQSRNDHHYNHHHPLDAARGVTEENSYHLPEQASGPKSLQPKPKPKRQPKPRANQRGGLYSLFSQPKQQKPTTNKATRRRPQQAPSSSSSRGELPHALSQPSPSYLSTAVQVENNTILRGLVQDVSQLREMMAAKNQGILDAYSMGFQVGQHNAASAVAAVVNINNNNNNTNNNNSRKKVKKQRNDDLVDADLEHLHTRVAARDSNSQLRDMESLSFEVERQRHLLREVNGALDEEIQRVYTLEALVAQQRNDLELGALLEEERRVDENIREELLAAAQVKLEEDEDWRGEVARLRKQLEYQRERVRFLEGDRSILVGAREKEKEKAPR